LRAGERKREENALLRVLVQDKLANGAERVLVVRPNLGEVENVDVRLFSLLRSHDLNRRVPSREVSRLDGAEEVFVRVVGVVTSELAGLLSSERLEAGASDVVPLEVNERAVLLDKLVTASEREGLALHDEKQGEKRGRTCGPSIRACD
jgi:hypothetical protein